jgi:hypothetical protein
VSFPCEQKSFSFPLKLIRHEHSPSLRPYSTYDQRVVGVPGFNQNCQNYGSVMKMAYIYLDHLVRVIKLILIIIIIIISYSVGA